MFMFTNHTREHVFLKNNMIHVHIDSSFEINSRDSNEADLITDEGLSTISILDIERIVRKTVSSADLAKSMCQIVGNSPIFSYHMMPFMSGVPSLYFHRLTSTTEEHNHAMRLLHILEYCNMQKYVVDGDGNCCFSAVAFSLMTNVTHLNDQQKHFLHTFGLDLSADMNSLAIQLRELTVTEWIEHSSLYEGFVMSAFRRRHPNFWHQVISMETWLIQYSHHFPMHFKPRLWSSHP